MRQEKSVPVGSLDRWCKRARGALGTFTVILTAMRVVLICIALLAVFSVNSPLEEGVTSEPVSEGQIPC